MCLVSYCDACSSCHQSKEQACAYIRANYPEIADRVPDVPDTPLTLPPHYGTNSDKLQKDLGITWTTFEDIVKMTVDRLLQLEKEFA